MTVPTKMSLTDVLLWLDRPAWPPRAPVETLMTPLPVWACLPQSKWTTDDWRAYAQFLIAAGQSMKAELLQTSGALGKARRKATRRKGPPPVTTLMSDRRTGRPTLIAEHRRAAEAYAIRLELEATRGRTSNEDALMEYYRRRGERPTKALNDPALGFMRKVRTAQNKAR